MKKKRLKSFKEERFFWILFATFCLVYFAFDNLTYREYIRSNSINDFGIADHGPNFFCVFALYTFYFLSSNGKEKTFLNWCLKVSGILIIYEILQLFIPAQTFDWKDIVATIIASVLAYFLLRFIRESYSNQN